MGDLGSVIPSGLHDNKLFGIVVWKMVNIQAQVLFQTESENFIPFEMTRFSKQFVPDLASCSLSETEMNLIAVIDKKLFFLMQMTAKRHDNYLAEKMCTQVPTHLVGHTISVDRTTHPLKLD